MQIGDVIILAVTQGLTEFLPVSSSGHLVLVRALFGISDVQGTAFDAFLHLGTLAAVLMYYWRVWRGIARGVFVADGEGRDKRQLAAKLAIATVPGAVAGYAFVGIADSFRSLAIVGAGLLVTATALLAGDFLARRAKVIERATFRDAVMIGLAQVLALLPGVSRSGMTMAAGRLRGLSREQAAHFSFLMSAPIIAGAGLASLRYLFTHPGVYSGGEMLLGFLVSWLAGLGAIFVFLRLLERISLRPFAVYLIVVSIVLFWIR